MFTSISKAVAAKCLYSLFSQTLRQTNKGKGRDLNNTYPDQAFPHLPNFRRHLA